MPLLYSNRSWMVSGCLVQPWETTRLEENVTSMPWHVGSRQLCGGDARCSKYDATDASNYQNRNQHPTYSYFKCQTPQGHFSCPSVSRNPMQITPHKIWFGSSISIIPYSENQCPWAIHTSSNEAGTGAGRHDATSCFYPMTSLCYIHLILRRTSCIKVYSIDWWHWRRNCHILQLSFVSPPNLMRERS